MIADARVLQPEFIPQEVEHRNAEVNHLSNALKPIMDGQSGETALLYGPSGAGKTCIAKYTVEKLRENVLDINTQYVNCWQDYSRYRVLYRILEGINETVDVQRQSTPKDELSARLHDYDGPQYVIILDEVDQLQDSKVLYDLYQAHKITMVLVANREEELFSQLEDRLVSRLQSCVRIQFDKYHMEELVAILEARARWGLTEDSIGNRELRLIADSAAGDARVGIGILRSAARRADQQGTDEITRSIIEEAVPAGKEEVRQNTLERLTDHQHALYDIIEEAGEISSGDLYERYVERLEDPKAKRTMRYHLKKLDHYGLITSHGEKRGRSYSIA
ncbi:Cdc6/Cdc18 family protein [Haloarchaeobius amylolyticus]|uniref:Cdc6/Cdc18 family protein n=1 Tax=Haloarchaeobius amylolyticus TaxID=1198296 RepID=UPI00226EC270|nr:Cdc6/Cdc18 family protein [Haloarchaeobius amylolyticus]